MWIPNSIVALIVLGTLYSLIFERPKGNYFRNKKRPDGNLSAKKQINKNINFRG